MFDISFTELLVVGVVALVVIGPQKLPKVARTIGHLAGKAQRYVNDVKSDIQREVDLDEFRKMKDHVEQAAQSVQSSLAETQSSLSKPFESIEQDTMSAFNGIETDGGEVTGDANSMRPTSSVKPYRTIGLRADIKPYRTIGDRS